MIQAISSRARDVKPERVQGAATLRVVPIVGLSHDEPPYRLLESETLAAVKVTEVSESGHVPELRVENTLDTRVLLIDGQELVGAKQNRVLNTDVLVPARTTLTIPVSCVEVGRWRYNSTKFSLGKSASHRVRAGKHQRVHDALKVRGQHDADQRKVWEEVAQSLESAKTQSPSGSLHDAYESCVDDLNRFRASLKMPDNTVGLAVFHGPRFMGLDLFDRHSTLRYFWETLLDSYAIDLLATPVDPTTADADAPPEATKIAEVLESAAAGKWDMFGSPGEGADLRLDHGRLSGSSLVWQDRVLIHLQLFPKLS